MSIVLFEDELICRLDPVAIGKPAFAVSCGAARLIDLVTGWDVPVHAQVREHLRASVAADYPAVRQDLPATDGPALWINARVAPSCEAGALLGSWWRSGRPGVIRYGDIVAAALVPAGASIDLARLAEGELPAAAGELPLFEYAHDVVRYHLKTLSANLEQRIARGTYQQLEDGVFLAEGASLGTHVVADTTRGPIVLETGASIGPYSYLSGPVHVGSRARVIEHAALKDCVAIGHTAKIGGEVEASIIEPYTNKQHHGFLGHSYLGSWINLGAGTCNSDLKNTYGQVNMEYRGQKVPTGMQFIGAIVGDYAKTAINTGIFTGKTVGVCSMVYGFVTTNVPSFVNYARLFGQVTEAPVDVMVATQRRMFERRGVEQRPCDAELLKAMYQLTEHERKQSGDPLSLEPLSL